MGRREGDWTNGADGELCHGPSKRSRNAQGKSLYRLWPEPRYPTLVWWIRNFLEPQQAATGGIEMPHRPASEVDRYVANRIRVQRINLSMTQQDFGERLNISFQQVQKYEKGQNRVSAGRLHQICGVLKVPLSFMFDGGPAGSFDPAQPKTTKTPAFINEFLATREGLDLIKAFTRIEDAELRGKIVTVVRLLAGGGKLSGRPRSRGAAGSAGRRRAAASSR
jgi:transcriptional regulator with XRE-family HTH domain